MYNTDDNKETQAMRKLEALQNELRRLGRVLIAFSGGVDSTFLLQVAHLTLGMRLWRLRRVREWSPSVMWQRLRSFAKSRASAICILILMS